MKMWLLAAGLSGLLLVQWPLAADAPADFRQALDLLEKSPNDASAKTQALALFSQSAAEYERLAENDYRLWYEAGTARWWAQQADLAIMDYRRYLASDPFRAEVWENLAQARLSAGTMAPGGEGPGAWPWLMWLLHALAISASLAVLALGLWIWNRRKGWFRLSLVLVILSAILGVGIVMDRVLPAPMALIITPTQGRKGDATVYAAQPAQPWKAGQEGWITERRSGWLRLEIAGGVSWVPASAVEEIEAH